MNESTGRVSDTEAIIALAAITEELIAYIERTGLSGPVQQALRSLKYRTAHLAMNLAGRDDATSDAYPRCATCAHWSLHSWWGIMHPEGYDRREATGTCAKLADGGTPDFITIGKTGKKKPPVDTDSQFGCILHEPK
jgi:hypothetical protein